MIPQLGYTMTTSRTAEWKHEDDNTMYSWWDMCAQSEVTWIAMLRDSDVDAIPWQKGCHRSNTDGKCPDPFFFVTSPFSLAQSVWILFSMVHEQRYTIGLRTRIVVRYRCSCLYYHLFRLWIPCPRTNTSRENVETPPVSWHSGDSGNSGDCHV